MGGLLAKPLKKKLQNHLYGQPVLTFAAREVVECLNQQLMSEAEQVMKNEADRGGCHPQRPKAEMDDTLGDLLKSPSL